VVSDCPHSQTGLQLAKGFRPCYPSGTWSQKIRSHKLTVIFGRQITKQYSGKLQTEIEDLHLGNPVIRSYYKNGFAKHYVRDHDVLRFEAASNDVKGDYGINQAVENLVRLRENLQGITERYQNVQQDILETFLDRGELRKLAEPTLQPHGRRIPAFKLDHARQLAVVSSLVRFSHVAAGDTFTTAELQASATNGNRKRATQLRMTLGLEVFTA